MKLLTRKRSALLFLCASFFLPSDRAWAQQAGQPVNMGGRMQGSQMGAAPRGRLRKLIMLRRMKRRAASGMGGARTGSH